MKEFWALYVLLVAIVVLLFVVTAPRTTHAATEDVTVRQVDNWVIAYSVERSSESYPYRDLVADVRRVIECEARQDLDVINMRRFGARGEVGPGQFMPGPGSIYYSSDAAAAGYTMSDPEANVAATVQLIAEGLGPENWSCW